MSLGFAASSALNTITMKYTTKGDRLLGVQLDKQVSGLLEATT